AGDERGQPRLAAVRAGQRRRPLHRGVATGARGGGGGHGRAVRAVDPRVVTSCSLGSPGAADWEGYHLGYRVEVRRPAMDGMLGSLESLKDVPLHLALDNTGVGLVACDAAG